MRNIRIWFKKTDTAKYISHLDLSRCMTRAIHKAKLPFWYTQGFNPHVFLTITMPISLGYTGLRESMDVKLTDDNYPFEDIITKLNQGLPKDVQVFEVTDVVMKPGDVNYSEYIISIDCDDSETMKNEFEELLSSDTLITEKKTKKGIKEIDIKPEFQNVSFDCSESKKLKIKMILLSSNAGSINPKLLFDIYSDKYCREIYPEVTRINCYNKNMEEFA